MKLFSAEGYRGLPWSAVSATKSLEKTSRWLQLQPSSWWLRWRKRGNKFSLCTIHVIQTILLGASALLNCRFKIVLVLRRRPLILIRFNNGKTKYGNDEGCTILIFGTDAGCTHWFDHGYSVPVCNVWYTQPMCWRQIRINRLPNCC